MDFKSFELHNRSYQLFEDGTLKVFTVSKNEWVPVLPKTVTIRGSEYIRYALYDPKYDWSHDNSVAIAKYDKAVDEFNRRRAELNMEGPVGGIVTDRLSDIIPPSVPIPFDKGEWKRYYRSHASLVLEYWYGVDIKGKGVRYIENVPGNKFHVANWICEDNRFRNHAFGGRKKLSVGLVNIILANCGSYSTEYIGDSLGISGRVVAKIIHGKGGYDAIGDREFYKLNLRSSRGSFYNIVCYPWELEYDFINRVMVMWDNETLYQKYVNTPCLGKNKTKGRMGYAAWEKRYGRDIRVSKELMKRWITLNSDCINDVEELYAYVDSWSLGSDRCWSIERYEKYMSSNKARMPKKVQVMKGIPCGLRNVGNVVHTHGSFYDMTDWKLLNLFDYVMGDFQSYDVDDMVNYVENVLEAEPDWESYEENGFDSADAFFDSYVSLLGGLSIGEFRDAYGDLLRSLPYVV